MKWTKTKESYADSPAPRFDTLEDIRRWIGDFQWEDVSLYFTRSQDRCCVCFEDWFQDFTLNAWACEVLYDHFYGEGLWAKRWSADFEKHQANVKAQAESLIELLRHEGFTQVYSYQGPKRFEQLFATTVVEGLTPEERKRWILAWAKVDPLATLATFLEKAEEAAATKH